MRLRSSRMAQFKSLCERRGCPEADKWGASQSDASRQWRCYKGCRRRRVAGERSRVWATRIRDGVSLRGPAGRESQEIEGGREVLDADTKRSRRKKVGSRISKSRTKQVERRWQQQPAKSVARRGEGQARDWTGKLRCRGELRRTDKVHTRQLGQVFSRRR